MFDEDTVYDLLEEIRKNAEDALSAVWETTHNKELWDTCRHLLCMDLDSSTHRGIDEGVDALYEELGIEFCEECGERVDYCTCEDEADAEEAEAEEVETK